LRQMEADQPLFASPHLYLSAIDLVRGDDAGYLRELNLQAQALHDGKVAALAKAGAAGLRSASRGGMLHALLAGRIAAYANGNGTAYAIAETYALLGKQRDALSYLATSLSRQ